MPSATTLQTVTNLLDGRTSQDVLTAAVQQGRVIDVYADPDASVVLLSGVLVDCRDRHLFLSVHCENASELAMNALSTLHAEFTLGGMVYHFETPELEDVESGGERLVRIHRPECITRVERRRSPRYGFRKNTKVEIILGREGQGQRLEGTLLNLSVDGLACKVTNADACRLHTHQTVTVKFNVSAARPALVLTGRVVSRTPGGSEGFTVIGLELDGRSDPTQTERVINAVRGDDGILNQGAFI